MPTPEQDARHRPEWLEFESLRDVTINEAEMYSTQEYIERLESVNEGKVEHIEHLEAENKVLKALAEELEFNRDHMKADLEAEIERLKSIATDFRDADAVIDFSEDEPPEEPTLADKIPSVTAMEAADEWDPPEEPEEPEEPKKCPECGGPLYITCGGGFPGIGVDVCRDCGYHPATHSTEEPTECECEPPCEHADDWPDCEETEHGCPRTDKEKIRLESAEAADAFMEAEYDAVLDDAVHPDYDPTTEEQMEE